jgi:stearoyl-CoA desaturase (delta-9 desaturase)
LDWDPTKWLIWITGQLGLAWDLYTVPSNEIEKAKIITAQKKLEEKKKDLDWGKKWEELEVLSWGESLKAYLERPENKEKEFLVIDGVLLDVKEFKSKHPGGSKILEGYILRGGSGVVGGLMDLKMKDATKAFYGNLNNHSRSARTYLEMLRAARVVDKDESKKAK